MQKKYMAILPLFALLGACGGGAGDTVTEALGIDNAYVINDNSSDACKVADSALKALDFNKVNISAAGTVDYTIALHKNNEVKNLSGTWSVVQGEDSDRMLGGNTDLSAYNPTTDVGSNKFSLQLPVKTGGKLILKLEVTDNDGFKQSYFCRSEVGVN